MNTARRSEGANPDLLVELGTEELPPRALKRLAEHFASGIVGWLAEAGFIAGTAPAWKWFATPRRLAVVVADVLANQPDRLNERRGPALSAAFDANGSPSRAAEGFARSCNVSVDDLETLKTDKGEWLVFRASEPGRALAEVVGDCIRHSVARLPIPKRMRWGDGDAEFVRPVHWLVVLHGDQVLQADVLSVSSGRLSRSHRFHGAGELSIECAGRYAQTLREQGSVWADYEERKLEIHLQVEQLARKIGGEAVIDDELLEEVCGLVERPVAVCGDFDERFLEVPRECLVSSMRDHQKYFHVIDQSGALLPHFITVSNIESSNPARVRQGNERVLRARLADAEFFWREDLRQGLAARLPQLDGLVFHHQLGSVADKSRRMAALAGRLARDLGADVEATLRAAQLCKADLVTAMVGEFPELQGVMGRYYALHDGEGEVVARAIEDHYRPRHAGDELPADVVSQLVAIADRVDSLTGIFATGEEPTGDKDPYALRRAALGLIRILIEGRLPLDVARLVEQGAALFNADGIEVTEQARARAVRFVVDRYPAYYAASGHAPDEIAAVVAVRPGVPLDVDRRIKAICTFRAQPAAASLAAANKRIGNILKKSPAPSAPMDFDLLREPAEQALAERIMRVGSQVSPLIARGDYDEALGILAGIREPVDRFFDEVLVMDPDAGLRNNRLALLGQLSGLFMGIADLSRLQVVEPSR